MRRRDVLAGLGALGVFGAAGATVYGGDLFESGGERIEPVEIERFDAPGSTAGTERVPEEGRATFLVLFATWCSVCKREMDPLATVATEVDEDVQFISVTNEPIGQTTEPEDVVDWWREHGGNWPVGHDTDLELTRRVDAPGVPYSVVFDADNRVTWSDAGYKEAETMLARIEDAR